MRAWILIAALGISAIAACASSPPNDLGGTSATTGAATSSGSTGGGGPSAARLYFDENVEPIFEGTCSDCHANADDVFGAPDWLGTSPDTYYDTVTSNPMMVGCDVENSILLLKGLDPLHAGPDLTSGQLGHIGLMHALHIAAAGLSPERHGAIEPDADFWSAPAFQIAAKIGWDFDGEGQPAALQSALHLGVMRDGWLLSEVTRAGELFQIGTALG